MLTYYMLSFSDRTVKRGEYLRSWSLVAVSPMQIKADLTFWDFPPMHSEGQVLQVFTEEEPNGVFVKKEGALYRELTQEERTRYQSQENL